ncbi:NAD(P)H-hydrate dehydratase [Nakamurella alba]|nr:NAD(P)H-hydrate dehydratase [Nakamurella alba]
MTIATPPTFGTPPTPGIPSCTVAQIRDAERAALARTPEGALMRRAAGELTTAVLDALDGHVVGRSVVLLVGAGNNGGDALWAGVALRRRGGAVTALLTDPARAHPAGAAGLRRVGGRLLDVARADVEKLLAAADVVIDGLVGLAARPPLREPAASLVRLANRCAALRVAVDLPSGLDPDSGVATGEIFDADVTVTFGGAKPGLLVSTSAGRVVVADLGMAPDPAVASVGVLTDQLVAGLLADPGSGDDKYSGGVVGIVAGSAQYPGAAVLAVGGAVRLRPGMVRYAGPQAAAVVQAWPEVVGADDPSRAGRVQAWVVGPGAGTDTAARDRLVTVLAADGPVLVDADGLTLLAAEPALLEGRRGPLVLTPHEGEFARLFPDLDLTDRLGAARAAAASTGAVILLKGHRTVIAAPDGRAYVNTTGSSWLATAGSGDVLAGVMGSLLATGIDPLLAAAAGAHLHGRAGERAAHDRAAGAHQLWDRLR